MIGNLNKDNIILNVVIYVMFWFWRIELYIVKVIVFVLLFVGVKNNGCKSVVNIDVIFRIKVVIMVG